MKQISTISVLQPILNHVGQLSSNVSDHLSGNLKPLCVIADSNIIIYWIQTNFSAAYEVNSTSPSKMQNITISISFFLHMV